MSLIGRIVFQPTTVRPGESVRVEVVDTNDDPLYGTNTQVKINGVPGAIQYLQFPSAGQRRVTVRARSSTGETEQQVALLDVVGGPVMFPSVRNQQDIAMVGVTQSASQPYVAVLTLGSLIDVRSPHLLHYGPSAPSHFGKVFARDSVAVRLAEKGVLGRTISQNSRGLVRIEARSLANTRPIAEMQSADGMRLVPKKRTRRAVAAVYDLSGVDLRGIFGTLPDAPPLEFEWDFGDGNVVTTASPTVSHDYFA